MEHASWFTNALIYLAAAVVVAAATLWIDLGQCEGKTAHLPNNFLHIDKATMPRMSQRFQIHLIMRGWHF